MSEKHYCIDCINFKMRVIKEGRCPQEFDTRKVRRALNRSGRVVIFICSITGAYYVNNFKVFRMQKECPYYNCFPDDIPVRITVRQESKK